MTIMITMLGICILCLVEIDLFWTVLWTDNDAGPLTHHFTNGILDNHL